MPVLLHQRGLQALDQLLHDFLFNFDLGWNKTRRGKGSNPANQVDPTDYGHSAQLLAKTGVSTSMNSAARKKDSRQNPVKHGEVKGFINSTDPQPAVPAILDTACTSRSSWKKPNPHAPAADL